MRNGSRVALAAFALYSAPAQAQIVINSPGNGPVVIERDQAGGGSRVVVHVGGIEFHSSDHVLNMSDFEKPFPDLYNVGRLDAAGGLSIRMSLSKVDRAGGADAALIAELTRLLQKLNDAAMRQCGPVVAVFGKQCRMSDLNLRANFQRGFNDGLHYDAAADARFEIALPGGGVQKPN